ncbi:MAG: hypothetical protein GC184_00630 [Rhizobiales bacterium]|nr:hypothetical protein [Hyphomicrobiales bacterium]
MPAFILPVILLIASNLFMTTAWYWHLRFKDMPILTVIGISWGLALMEYCLAVPANRLGSAVYSPAQLKTIQEVVTLVVFTGFSAVYLGQSPNWHTALGFGLIALGAAIVFRG